MPKLLTFGVCRQVIIDRDSGSISMIGLINNLTVVHPFGETLGAEASSPFEWGVVTAWLRMEEDKGKTFEQYARLVSPDGKTQDLPVATLSFNSSADMRVLTNVAKGNGFPVGQPGIVNFVVGLKEAGTDQDWEVISEYPIEVIYQFQEGNTIVPS